jgi:hypothetical protein
VEIITKLIASCKGFSKCWQNWELLKIWLYIIYIQFASLGFVTCKLMWSFIEVIFLLSFLRFSSFYYGWKYVIVCKCVGQAIVCPHINLLAATVSKCCLTWAGLVTMPRWGKRSYRRPARPGAHSLHHGWLPSSSSTFPHSPTVYMAVRCLLYSHTQLKANWP